MIKLEDLNPYLRKKDEIAEQREIKPGFHLLTMRAGPKAHVFRYLVVRTDGTRYGEIKRPCYGTRAMEAWSANRSWDAQFSIAMRAPAHADQVLVDHMVAFIKEFA